MLSGRRGGDGRPWPGPNRTPYDLAVIGSGGAAFAAAIRARDLDATVALVEAGEVGGTCVNVGCIPSKAMLAASEAWAVARESRYPGVGTAAVALDLKALRQGTTEIVDSLRQSRYLELAEAYGIDMVPGRARFEGPHTLAVGRRRVRAGAVIVASGALPAAPPIPGLRQAGYLTSTTALQLTDLPEHLVVIGAGAVGLEMGQLFLHLGARVTLLESALQIAPGEEPEISTDLAQVLREEGAEVMTGVRIDRVSKDGWGWTVHFRLGDRTRSVSGSHLLVATGRRPNTARLGLGRIGVALTQAGAVSVDGTLRTSVPSVFAAGDAAGLPQFVYVAARSGTLAASNALGQTHEKLDLTGLPRIIFTRPQAARAGLTEAEVLAQGINCECRSIPLEVLPRALVNRDQRGVFKLVAERETGRVLGVSILAPGAGDLILAAVYAIQLGATVQQLAESWGPYLTLGEGLKLVAQAFTRDVGRLSCCAA
jgi:mercuric reductase